MSSSPNDTRRRPGVDASATVNRWRPWRQLRGLRRSGSATNASERAVEDFNRGVMLAAVGDEGAALDAYRCVIRSATGGLAAKAAFNVAVLCGDDVAAATEAYRVAIDTEDADVAPKAAFNLGLLLERHGDLSGAERAFHRACGFGQPDVNQNAAVKLAQLGAAAQASGTISPASPGPRLPRRRTRRNRGYPAGGLAIPARASRSRRARGHTG
jgi:hypothetical protein